MDKTIVFVALLVVLFIGQVFMNENFYNFAGSTDMSGNITLSLSDLISLLGSGTSVTSLTDKKKDKAEDDYYKYKKLRSDIMSEVKDAVKSEMLSTNYDVMDDSCIDSFSSQQGSDFMKYIPGKNPDDYIRKDSVPCYGCSIPT